MLPGNETGAFSMVKKYIRFLILAVLLINSCNFIPATQPESRMTPEAGTLTKSIITASPIPRMPTQTSEMTLAATEITPSATAQLMPRVEVQIAAQVGGEVTDIEINGTYAYLAVGPRLVVMDLSNPDILQVATMSDLLPGLGKALAIEGGWLCWVSDSGYLLVFTLEDPTKPSLVGQYEIPQKADEVVIKD